MKPLPLALMMGALVSLGLAEPAAAQGADSEMPSLLGRTAHYYFKYSMGRFPEGPPCFSCDFFAIFISAFSGLSASIFHFLQVFFVWLAPLMIAIWIAFRSFGLLFNGGEQGGHFKRSIALKLGFFFLVFLIFTANYTYMPRDIQDPIPNEMPWVWSISGPETAGAVFGLGQEARQAVLSGSSDANMGCEGILQQVTIPLSDAVGAFGEDAAQLACITERTHIVGMAVSIAMIEGAWASINADIGIFSARSDASRLFGSVIYAIIMSIFGVLLIAVFFLSMVWWIFTLLDVVVRVLFMAALWPGLALAILFKPSRRFGLKALSIWISGLVRGFGVAIVIAINFALIVSVPQAFDRAVAALGPETAYEDVRSMETRPENPIRQMEEFVIRVSLDQTNDWFIPMWFTAPWFVYFMIIGLAMFALGKKVMSMLDNVAGTQMIENMGDAAKQMASNALKVGAVAGLGFGVWAGVQTLKTPGRVETFGEGVAGWRGGEEGLAKYRKYNPEISLRGTWEGAKSANPFGRKGGSKE
jgi:hypothetical protein